MKNLYPTYRGKLDDGSVVMDMVDRNGRTWATGVGADRVQAQYAARHNTPPKGVVRSVLSYAQAHPMKAAFVTALAVTTYSAIRSRSSGAESGGGFADSGMGIGTFLATAVIAYLGIKVLGWLVGDDN
ncbi:MAG: hypothetical protein Q8O51_01450 [bacterium]|nr:hypothetical protein [bacterium]